MNRNKHVSTRPLKPTLETTNLSPPTSPPWGIATKSIVAVVSLLLFTLMIWRFQSLISPLVIALILAYLLNPLINLVEKRIGIKRGIAVLLVYVLLALIVLGGATVLGLVVANQVQWLSDELPGLIARAPALFQSLLGYLPTGAVKIGPYTFDSASTFQGLDWNSFVQQAASLVQPFFSTSGSLVGLLAQKTLNVVTLSFLIFVTSIYIARDIPRMGGAIGNLAHQPGYRQDAERLMNDFIQIWNSYLRGQVILGLVMGMIVGVVLAILGVNNALALGLLSGGLEFLPIVGPLIGGAAAVLVAFFQVGNYLGLSPFHFALLILVVMIILQQLENNLLVPRIVGDALDLHPILVMISVLMGASLAGILGAVLAAPVVASLKLIGAYAWRKMLDLPPFPDPPPPAQDEFTIKPAGLLWRLQSWTASFNTSNKRKR